MRPQASNIYWRPEIAWGKSQALLQEPNPCVRVRFVDLDHHGDRADTQRNRPLLLCRHSTTPKRPKQCVSWCCVPVSRTLSGALASGWTAPSLKPAHRLHKWKTSQRSDGVAIAREQATSPHPVTWGRHNLGLAARERGGGARGGPLGLPGDARCKQKHLVPLKAPSDPARRAGECCSCLPPPTPPETRCRCCQRRWPSSCLSEPVMEAEFNPYCAGRGFFLSFYRLWPIINPRPYIFITL